MIRLLDEAEALDQVSRDLYLRVSEIVASLDSKLRLSCLRGIIYRRFPGPVPHVDTVIQGETNFLTLTLIRNFAAELRQLDISMRNNVSSVTQIKVF